MIEFTIPGIPVGKGRPRAARRGKHITMYTPAKTVSYESTVALFASQAMGARSPLNGPVSADLIISLPVPASWSKKRTQAALSGLEHPAKKPDADNVIKGIFDGMNGIVWVDDVQVVALTAIKQYAQVPGVQVRITEYQKEAA